MYDDKNTVLFFAVAKVVGKGKKMRKVRLRALLTDRDLALGRLYNEPFKRGFNNSANPVKLYFYFKILTGRQHKNIIFLTVTYIPYIFNRKVYSDHSKYKHT